MKLPNALLVVHDLEKSLTFYTELLSFELVERQSDCVWLRRGGHEIIMFQGSSPGVDYDHGYNANSTLLFTVDDLDSEISRLKSKGIDFIHKEPNQNRWGRYSAFKDPSGIVHEFFELF